MKFSRSRAARALLPKGGTVRWATLPCLRGSRLNYSLFLGGSWRKSSPAGNGSVAPSQFPNPSAQPLPGKGQGRGRTGTCRLPIPSERIRYRGILRPHDEPGEAMTIWDWIGEFCKQAADSDDEQRLLLPQYQLAGYKE